MLDLVLAYSSSSINAGCGGGELCLLTRSVELSWVPSEPPGKQDLMGPQLEHWTLTVPRPEPGREL